MPKSLADQLLQAGLVDDKKVKQAKKEKRQQKKQIKSGTYVESNEAELARQQQKQAQVERDRALNRERQQAAEEKARLAQVKQMLEQSQRESTGDIRFNFADPRTNAVKALHVDETTQKHLANGKLCICAHEEHYYVVPSHVADKVAERYESAVIFRADTYLQEPDEDDPYKDYQIPDDLMW